MKRLTQCQHELLTILHANRTYLKLHWSHGYIIHDEGGRWLRIFKTRTVGVLWREGYLVEMKGFGQYKLPDVFEYSYGGVEYLISAEFGFE